MSTAIARSVPSAEPAKEPVTVEELKDQLDLPIADTFQDELLTAALLTARELVEHDTGQVAYQRTYVLKFDYWPSKFIELDRWPLISVTSITYLDTAGSSQTLSTGEYEVDTARVVPAIWPTYSATWPGLQAIQNAVTVTYIAGYSSVAAVPAMYKHAVKLAAAREYFDRQGIVHRFDDAYEAVRARLNRATYP